MRRFALSLGFLLLSFVCSAQYPDKIVTKSGEIILCRMNYSAQNEENVYYSIDDPNGGEEVRFIRKADIEYIYSAVQKKEFFPDSRDKWIVMGSRVGKAEPKIEGTNRINIGLGISQNPTSVQAYAFFANCGFTHYFNNVMGIGATTLLKVTGKSPALDRKTQSFFIGPSITGSHFIKKNRSYCHGELAFGYSLLHIGEGRHRLHKFLREYNHYATVSLAASAEFLVSDKTGIDITLRYVFDIVSTTRQMNPRLTTLDAAPAFDCLSLTAGMRF